MFELFQSFYNSFEQKWQVTGRSMCIYMHPQAPQKKSRFTKCLSISIFKTFPSVWVQHYVTISVSQRFLEIIILSNSKLKHVILTLTAYSFPVCKLTAPWTLAQDPSPSSSAVSLYKSIKESQYRDTVRRWHSGKKQDELRTNKINSFFTNKWGW